MAMRQRQTRRGVLGLAGRVGAAGAALAGVLEAACAPGAAGGGGQRPETGPVKLTYLRYYNQPNRLEAEQAIFKRLQDQRRGLTIEELTVAGTGEMIQSMTASYAAGTAPDTWTTAPTIYHEYVRAGNLLGLDDLIKKDVDPKKHFMETMPEWESPAASGKHFGLTRDFVVTILYYNKNLFDAARVPYPDTTWTYDTVLQHASKFARQQDSPEASEWAFIAGAAHGHFDPAVRANGGQILNKQRTRAVMDGSAATAAEFNMNYSKWQGVKNTAINDALNGKLGVREALRQATEEANKILAEAYPQA